MKNETVTVTRLENLSKEEMEMYGTNPNIFQVNRFQDEHNWSLEIVRAFLVEMNPDESKSFFCFGMYDSKKVVRIAEDLNGNLSVTLDNRGN